MYESRIGKGNQSQRCTDAVKELLRIVGISIL